MKKFIGIVAAAVIVLLLASPVLAASLGISPSHVELEVPGDGSATANFKVYYFSGDIKVSLVDIPLEVEPETLHIEPSSEPVDIELTIYGDESLGSHIYNGYIRFLGMSGDMVAVAVRVKAKITHIVEGQSIAEEPTSEETQTLPEATLPKETSPVPTLTSTDTLTPTLAATTSIITVTATAPPPEASSESDQWIIPVAGIIAGAAILITIILVLSRRRRY